MEDQVNNPPAQEEAQAEQPMATFADLEAYVDQAKAQEATQDKGEQQLGGEHGPLDGQEQAADPIAQTLAQTGFKSVEELAKSQKEAHATITRLSQERAAMQRDLEALKAFPAMVMQQMQNQQPQQPAVQPRPAQGQADSLTEELYKDMAPFIQQDVERRAAEIASTIVDQKIAMRELGSKVSAKRSENPEEFDELRPIMLNILQNNPHYEAHPQGLNVVYDMAKQVRDNRMAKIASRLFGTDVPLDKVQEALRMVMQGQQPQQAQQPVQPANPSAYVPPAGAGTPPMMQKQVNYDTEIRNRMQGKMGPNTVDEITDIWWQKINTQAQSQDNRPRR